MSRRPVLVLLLINLQFVAFSQKTGNDVTTPLHAIKPDYPVFYGAPAIDSVKKALKQVYNYLNAVTPAEFIDRLTQNMVQARDADTNTIIKPGDFRLTSYEWGVTYSGMLHAGEITGDTNYTHYARERMEFLANAYPFFKKIYETYPSANNALRQPVAPRALDDGGAVCAAMIKMLRAGGSNSLRPLISHYTEYISTKEYRLRDGTLARNRPQKNTLWLDDMFMGIPALAQMGKLTGEQRYFDDAVNQVKQYAVRMFNPQLNIYMHGWVEEMGIHPEFHWARANGWAMLAMCELLDVLPESHSGRNEVLGQLRLQIRGILPYQSGQGLWHQLLDKNDSYLETSASAIYTYCLAHAINKKWIDAKAYAPATILAWNAVAQKLNSNGQVAGTCVGTGMAFDPAFYYYRPVNVFAAHGYGPVLLAGAEIISLLKKFSFEINDSSLQLTGEKK